MPAPSALSVVIVSYNTRADTVRCAESLTSEVPSEVIVVDNGSTDGTVDALRSVLPWVRVLVQKENLGFARAANIGAAAATSPYLAFVNSDCVAQDGCLNRLVGYLDERPGTSVAVPRLLDEQRRVQRNVGRLPTLSSIALEYLAGRITDPYELQRLSEPTPVEAFSGAALMIRRLDFWAAGGFHEDYFMYVEDVELSRRLGSQRKLIEYVPDAIMFHAEGGSSGPRADALTAMLHRHREDYARRTMGRLGSAAAVAAMRLGLRSAPARNRLLAALKRTDRAR